MTSYRVGHRGRANNDECGGQKDERIGEPGVPLFLGSGILSRANRIWDRATAQTADLVDRRLCIVVLGIVFPPMHRSQSEADRVLAQQCKIDGASSFGAGGDSAVSSLCLLVQP